MQNLPPDALIQVAAYFQALAEPLRLSILNLLRGGEHNVGEIAQACQSSSANVSRHLSLLMHRGLVKRQTRGNAVYYSMADESVYALCELVCGSIARQHEHAIAEQKAFSNAIRQPAGRAVTKGRRAG